MPHKSSHVIVKSHQHRKRQIALALLLVAALLAMWLSYEYGRRQAGYDSMAAARQQEGLRQTIQALEEKNQALGSQIAILQQASEVDRHAYKEVEQTLKTLQDEILEMREEVKFYRGIVGPADVNSGLQIQSFMARENDQDNGYHFRLIMVQYGRQTRAVRGNVRITLVGIQDGAQKSLLLKELGDPRRTQLKFRFKYFQELNGDIVLPEGFVPIQVVLNIVPQGKGAKPSEKTFNWSDVIS
ncbi:MAG TPA: hypothetical protein ENJ22_04395 [Gammaproteobacteria bacterium]|nr:hypothetical protein [Gammaproteobacteria bacterium]